MWFLEFKRQHLVSSHFSIMFCHSSVGTLVLKKLQLKVVLQENVNIKSNHKYLFSILLSSNTDEAYQFSKRFK